MARRDDAAAAAARPNEDQVAQYLRDNPDFLLRRPELAVRLAVPARRIGEGVADLQHYMIERLRAELEQMRGCAEHLITTTRTNMSTQARTHDAALAMLAAGDMAELMQVLGDLAGLLDVDAVALAFESADAVIPALAAAGVQRLPAGGVDALLGEDGREAVLHAAAAGSPSVFGSAAGLVRSQALVRLPPEGRCPPGILALGSRHERTFHPGQGTELLVFLGRMAQYAVQRWVSR